MIDIFSSVGCKAQIVGLQRKSLMIVDFSWPLFQKLSSIKHNIPSSYNFIFEIPREVFGSRHRLEQATNRMHDR